MLLLEAFTVTGFPKLGLELTQQLQLLTDPKFIYRDNMIKIPSCCLYY